MSHYTIAFIVDAENREDAKASIEDLFNGGNDYSFWDATGFDYGEVMDGDGKDLGVPRVSPIDSKEGQALLQELMRGMRGTWVHYAKQLYRKMRRARSRGVSFERMWEHYTENQVRYAAHQLGSYAGPAIALYEENGGGIANEVELRRHLTNRIGVGETRFVVPADVHY